jgi:hypothetical protein
VIAGSLNAGMNRPSFEAGSNAMEHPGSWNLLTGSLAVSDLSQEAAAWAFLTTHGLVRNDPGDEETFITVVRQEIERGPITGPTEALRVAMELERLGIALPAGRTPDPFGKIAAERLKACSPEEKQR